MKYCAHSMLGVSLACLSLACSGCVNKDGATAAAYSYKNFTSQRELNGATEIRADLELTVGQVELNALPDDDTRAYHVDVDYDERAYGPELDVRSLGSVMEFQFKLRHLNLSGGMGNRNRADIRFSGAVPLDLSVKTGVGENHLDLTGLRVRDLDLTTGVGEIELSVTSPNRERCRRVHIRNGVGELNAVGLGHLNFRELEFEGGVGTATLDLTGEWGDDADINISVGIGAVNVVLPLTVGAELHASKNFLSGLNLRDFKQESSGTYRSANFDRVAQHLKIDVKSGIGSVDFRWK